MADEVLSMFKQEKVDEKTVSSKKLKFGILGCGMVANVHARAVRAQHVAPDCVADHQRAFGRGAV